MLASDERIHLLEFNSDLSVQPPIPPVDVVNPQGVGITRLTDYTRAYTYVYADLNELHAQTVLNDIPQPEVVVNVGY